ncbi:Phosphatidylinositol 3- and 4-kinase [Giardia muris]|uniref:Phosphatidylinositol 3-and 4-kinase n=1 Tax=Giardia muris TaxID=5742 RepID=A0A4Z1SWE8_GIAMU|nr:Phosphatidylinositol 3- and 4-kinase [Giardia muris]|eukprot:TNJ30094.1 Phosphatidylinositol 3- and 4-kinase [Giardia muris]
MERLDVISQARNSDEDVYGYLEGEEVIRSLSLKSIRYLIKDQDGYLHITAITCFNYQQLLLWKWEEKTLSLVNRNLDIMLALLFKGYLSFVDGLNIIYSVIWLSSFGSEGGLSRIFTCLKLREYLVRKTTDYFDLLPLLANICGFIQAYLPESGEKDRALVEIHQLLTDVSFLHNVHVQATTPYRPMPLQELITLEFKLGSCIQTRIRSHERYTEYEHVVTVMSARLTSLSWYIRVFISYSSEDILSRIYRNRYELEQHLTKIVETVSFHCEVDLLKAILLLFRDERFFTKSTSQKLCNIVLPLFFTLLKRQETPFTPAIATGSILDLLFDENPEDLLDSLFDLNAHLPDTFLLIVELCDSLCENLLELNIEQASLLNKRIGFVFKLIEKSYHRLRGHAQTMLVDVFFRFGEVIKKLRSILLNYETIEPDAKGSIVHFVQKKVIKALLEISLIPVFQDLNTLDLPRCKDILASMLSLCGYISLQYATAIDLKDRALLCIRSLRDLQFSLLGLEALLFGESSAYWHDSLFEACVVQQLMTVTPTNLHHLHLLLPSIEFQIANSHDHTFGEQVQHYFHVLVNEMGSNLSVQEFAIIILKLCTSRNDTSSSLTHILLRPNLKDLWPSVAMNTLLARTSYINPFNMYVTGLLDVFYLPLQKELSPETLEGFAKAMGGFLVKYPRLDVPTFIRITTIFSLVSARDVTIRLEQRRPLCSVATILVYLLYGDTVDASSLEQLQAQFVGSEVMALRSLSAFDGFDPSNLLVAWISADPDCHMEITSDLMHCLLIQALNDQIPSYDSLNRRILTLNGLAKSPLMRYSGQLDGLYSQMSGLMGLLFSITSNDRYVGFERFFCCDHVTPSRQKKNVNVMLWWADILHFYIKMTLYNHVTIVGLECLLASILLFTYVALDDENSLVYQASLLFISIRLLVREEDGSLAFFRAFWSSFLCMVLMLQKPKGEELFDLLAAPFLDSYGDELVILTTIFNPLERLAHSQIAHEILNKTQMQKQERLLGAFLQFLEGLIKPSVSHQILLPLFTQCLESIVDRAFPLLFLALGDTDSNLFMQLDTVPCSPHVLDSLKRVYHYIHCHKDAAIGALQGQVARTLSQYSELLKMSRSLSLIPLSIDDPMIEFDDIPLKQGSEQLRLDLFLRHLQTHGNAYACSCASALFEFLSKMDVSPRLSLISLRAFQELKQFLNNSVIELQVSQRELISSSGTVITCYTDMLAQYLDFVTATLTDVSLGLGEPPKLLCGLEEAWKVVKPFVGVIPKTGPFFFHYLTNSLEGNQLFTSFYRELHVLFCLHLATLLTEWHQLPKNIDQQFRRNFYIPTSSTGSFVEVDVSLNRSISIQDGLSNSESMRVLLATDILSLHNYVQKNALLTEYTFSVTTVPEEASKAIKERLIALKLANTLSDIGRISLFLDTKCFGTYFQSGPERFSFVPQLLSLLRATRPKKLPLLRLVGDLDAQINGSRAIPKASKDFTMRLMDFVNSNILFTCEPLKLILVVAVYYPLAEVMESAKKKLYDILDFISQAYASNFALSLLYTFDKKLILTILQSAGSKDCDLDLRARRSARVADEGSVIQILTKTITSESLAMHYYDLRDASPNNQLLDRYYGVAYFILEPFYARATGYSNDDPLSMSTNLHPPMNQTTTCNMERLLARYRLFLLGKEQINEIVNMLVQRDFNKEMILLIDEFPSNVQAILTYQLHRYQEMLFEHNCRFVYHQIFNLSIVCYRSFKYINITRRSEIQGFLLHYLDHCSLKTKLHALNGMFFELVDDVEQIDAIELIRASSSNGQSQAVGLLIALQTYAFFLDFVTEISKKDPRVVDCWSNSFQTCFLAALSAWMLFTNQLIILLSQHTGKLRDEALRRSNLLVVTILYCLPIIDGQILPQEHAQSISILKATFGASEEARTRDDKSLVLKPHAAQFMETLCFEDLLQLSVSRLHAITERAPISLIQQQFGNVCRVLQRFYTVVSGYITQPTASLFPCIRNNILVVFCMRMLPFGAHFDLAFRQFGVQYSEEGLDTSAFKGIAFVSFVEQICNHLRGNMVFAHAFEFYTACSRTMTRTLSLLQKEYDKKAVVDRSISLAEARYKNGFTLLPTREALDELQAFERCRLGTARFASLYASQTDCNGILADYQEYFEKKYSCISFRPLSKYCTKRSPLKFSFTTLKDTYNFILKCNEETVTDHAIMDFLAALQTQLTDCHFRPYFIATLCNVPEKQIGVIEYIPGNVIVLDDILTPILMQGRKQSMSFYDSIVPSPGGLYPELDMFILCLTGVAHLQALCDTDHCFSFLRNNTENRMRFIDSLAQWCAVGIVTGLGDRHACNILVDKDDGSVHFIDFEAVFEYPKLLTYGELVPFRLTGLLAHLLGPTGVHGRFFHQLVRTVSAIQKNLSYYINVFYPLAIQKGNIHYIAKIYHALSSRTAEEIATEALVQSADSSRLGSMYIGWMPFL